MWLWQNYAWFRACLISCDSPARGWQTLPQTTETSWLIKPWNNDNDTGLNENKWELINPPWVWIDNMCIQIIQCLIPFILPVFWAKYIETNSYVTAHCRSTNRNVVLFLLFVLLSLIFSQRLFINSPKCCLTPSSCLPPYSALFFLSSALYKERRIVGLSTWLLIMGLSKCKIDFRPECDNSLKPIVWVFFLVCGVASYCLLVCVCVCVSEGEREMGDEHALDCFYVFQHVFFCTWWTELTWKSLFIYAVSKG